MSNWRLVIMAVVGVFSSANADVLFVDDNNCPGPGSGMEGDPYCSIQTAIDNAVDMDEIVVAPGTYFEVIDLLGKAITLLSSDGAKVTIIDGTGFFTHVVQCVSGEGPDTVLDGFTITGGDANGDFPDNFGGGMYNLSSSPTVTNCTFSGNMADFAGGMYNSHCSPTVIDCTFSGNTAGVGGGLYNSHSSAMVTNCTFSENSASNGGGMYSFSGSPTLTNCTFSGNMAGENGGGLYSSNTEQGPTLNNCTFIGNTATLNAGAMFNFNSNPEVTGCTFSGNTAGVGGGMTSVGASVPTVTNCTFCGNSPEHIDGEVVLGGQIQMSTFCPIPVCPGDITGDGEVGITDFLELLGQWGPCP